LADDSFLIPTVIGPFRRAGHPDGSREVSPKVTQHPSPSVVSKSAHLARRAMFYHGYRHRQILAAWQSADGKIEKTAIGKIANLPDQSRRPSELKPFKTDLWRMAFVDRAHETSTHSFDCTAVV
jgi:hypothetical protein